MQSKRRTHGWQIDPTPPFIGALATRTVHPPAINVPQLRVVDAERGRKLATREIPGNAGPTRGIMEVSFPPSTPIPLNSCRTLGVSHASSCAAARRTRSPDRKSGSLQP
jgi:hypothetical protein